MTLQKDYVIQLTLVVYPLIKVKTQISTPLILRKICRYSELFWSVFYRIWTEYGDMWSISPYSVRMQENTDQNNSEYGKF